MKRKTTGGARRRNYALGAGARLKEFPAPRLPYRPWIPKRGRHRIGLIGCGGITASHLEAYRSAGLHVVALCDMRDEAARLRRDAFYPKAEVYTEYRKLLDRDDIGVVDVALHVKPRPAVIRDALDAGKHVLSQKPFVADLATGAKLVALAKRLNLKLAVNQNGRWAPYVRYMDLAVRAGHIGEVQGVNIRINWDHTWIKGTAFEQMPHVVLHDFAIHWFDMCTLFFGARDARSVFAAAADAPGQTIAPPMIGSAAVAYDHGAAVLHFDGHSKFGPREEICITGTAGTLRASGPVCAAHEVELFTRRGRARPQLDGKWFNDGFLGAMGELLRSIEHGDEPSNSARDNLRSLALCFAAVHSARSGRPAIPGAVRRV